MQVHPLVGQLWPGVAVHVIVFPSINQQLDEVFEVEASLATAQIETESARFESRVQNARLLDGLFGSTECELAVPSRRGVASGGFGSSGQA